MNLIEIDANGLHPLAVEEAYKQVDRRNHSILIKNVGNTGRVVMTHYPDFEYKNDGSDIFYHQVDYGELEFEIGCLKLPYVRELPNRAYRNERAVEVALGKWFAETFNNDVLEIGDVCWQYEGFKGWRVLDPFGPYPQAIRKDVMDFDYSGLNVFSLSTFEHMNPREYSNN